MSLPLTFAGPSAGGSAGPWWDPANAGLSVVGAWQAKGAATYAASLVNLANPGTYNLTELNGAVPWAALSGWGFVAADTKSFNTGIVPANDQSYSIIVQYANMANTGSLAGMSHGAGREFLFYSSVGPGSIGYRNGGETVVAPGLVSGNVAIGGNLGYRNGVQEGAAIGVWTGASTRAIYIGSGNFGVAIVHTTADIYAVAIYNAPLTGLQVAAIAAAMAAL